MGATYTRQSSSAIVDGGVIEAADINAEFDQILAAFAVTSGHTHDGTAAEGGPITKLLGTAITIGDATAGTDIAVTFDGESNDGVVTWMEDEDYFQFSDDLLLTTTEKLQFRDTAIYINSSADGQLDLVADTEIQIAATTIDINGAVALNGAITGATNITLSGELDAATLDISGNADIDGTLETDALSINGTAVTSTATELNLLDGVSGLVQADFTKLAAVDSTAAELNILDGVTSTAAELNLVDGITAGTVSASKAVIVDSNKDLTGFRNLTISGDLTVSGDDITMGTNTAGNILVADGTNFNSVAVGGLSEISTVANDDVFLAVDTSGGGLKKIARSAVVAGLATSSAISNVVEDTSPQLGGNLDTNSFMVDFDDGHGIRDENGNEHIIFQTTSSAVNHFDITNAATGNPPKLQATGGDSNIDLDIEAKGTGHVTVRGNTNAGAIQFNCESNSHGQILKSQPHSAAVTNVMLLPAGADSTLVSLVSTDILTNKTLTTPVITEIDSGSTITLDATTDIVLDADGGDIFFKDGGTTFGSATNNSGELLIKSGTTTAMTFSGANVTLEGNLTVSGTTTTVNSTTVNLNDHNIVLDSGNSTSAVVNGAGITLEGGSGDDASFTYNTTGPTFELKLGSSHEDLQVDKLTANGGVVVDNITIDGTEIDLSSGDLTIDVAGDITLDAGGGDIRFDGGGSEYGKLNLSGNNLNIHSSINDADIVFKGIDNGSTVTALTLDMSAAGAATFNSDVTAGSDVTVGDDLFLLSDSSVIHFGADSDITLTHLHNTGLVVNSGTGSNTFQIQSTDPGSGNGPIMKFYRNSSSPADSDNTGEIRFIFNNDAGQETESAVIETIISDVSDGTEDATFDIKTMSAGTMRSRVVMETGGTVFNQDSADIDFRVESNNQVSAFLIDAGNDTSTFNVPVTFNNGAANVTQEALTSSSNAVAWDATDKPNAYHQTSENTTFSAPSNAVEGAFICVEINYNGSHTIAWNTVFEFAASTAPTATSTDGKTDILVFRYNGAVWQEVGRTLNLSES